MLPPRHDPANPRDFRSPHRQDGHPPNGGFIPDPWSIRQQEGTTLEVQEPLGLFFLLQDPEGEPVCLEVVGLRAVHGDQNVLSRQGSGSGKNRQQDRDQKDAKSQPHCPARPRSLPHTCCSSSGSASDSLQFPACGRHNRAVRSFKNELLQQSPSFHDSIRGVGPLTGQIQNRFGVLRGVWMAGDQLGKPHPGLLPEPSSPCSSSSLGQKGRPVLLRRIRSSLTQKVGRLHRVTVVVQSGGASQCSG